MESTTLTSPAEQSASTTVKSLTPGVELVRLTAGEFIKLHGFTQIEKTLNKSSVNGVPFVQFYTPENECYCIFTSKAAGEIIEEMDMDKGSKIPEGWLKNFKFMWSSTPSAEGGMAWKMVSPKEGGNRDTLDEYL